MLTTIAVPVLDGVSPFELGVLCEVFGLDRSAQGLPALDFRVCAEHPGRPMTTRAGFAVVAEHPFSAMEDADLVAVPAGITTDAYPPQLLDQLRRAVDRGAWVMSVCTGAFALAAAGVLDGRRCTTHWMHVEELAAAVPSATVETDMLYVADDKLLTSAGTAAGIDAALHLVRAELGSGVASAIARRMVVPPHRDGGQRQYVEAPVALVPCDTLQPVLTFAIEHLAEDLSIGRLAQRAVMSERTFARRFRAETGTTPHQWVSGQRVLLARRLLEDTDLAIEDVAQRSGLGTSAMLRHHFTPIVGATPAAYRRAFCPPAEPRRTA